MSCGADGRGPPLHVVLVEPLIPQNTGSVGRLCVGIGARLHLVEPLGFAIDERAVRRAGLDYWKDVDLAVHRGWGACEAALDLPPDRFHFLTAHGTTPYTAVAYRWGDVLVFGRETTGLEAPMIDRAADRAITVPRFGPIRSYNLATTVGIVAFEALRRVRPADFPLHSGPPDPS